MNNKLKELIVELMERLDMEDGLPMIDVYSNGGYFPAVIADADILNCLMHIQELLAEENDNE